VLRGAITLSEIKSQSQLWTQALEVLESQAMEAMRFWTNGQFDQVIFTGCGSTYYLGVMGATLLQASTGVPARAISASELILFPEVNFFRQRKTLLICLSRSGTTRETVNAAHLFRQHSTGNIIVITCDSQSPLADTADLLLAIDAAQEQSRVQTRSFSSMGVILTALTAMFGGLKWQQLNTLPTILERLMAKSEALIQALGEDTSITQFAFLGSGAQYGLACEAMLKMTEMSRVFSVSYHVLEYLHGPRYAADKNTLIVGLLSESAHDEEIKAFESLRQHGIRVLVLSEEALADKAWESSEVIAVQAGLPEWGRTLLYLPPLQLLGWHQAVQRGFDPDNLPFDPRTQSTE
jgi:glutamine---fructose-6-phosphate transaminase (isomerizing)